MPSRALQARLDGRVFEVRARRPGLRPPRSSSTPAVTRAALFGDFLHVILAEPAERSPSDPERALQDTSLRAVEPIRASLQDVAAVKRAIG